MRDTTTLSLFLSLAVAGCSAPVETPTTPTAPTNAATTPAADPQMTEAVLTPAAESKSIAEPAQAHGKAVRRVFTQSNDATSNEVLAFAQAKDGTLSAPKKYATGGRGTGAGLGSQGAVTLSADGSALIAVNAGSNEISVFAVGKKNLVLTDRHDSGGTMPVSVTISGNVIFVVNAGGAGSVAGFVVSHAGKLTPIAGATRPLTKDGAGAAQVAVTPSADAVVVTEKASNCIDVFPLSANATIGAATCVPSAGTTPFGFAFASSVDLDGYLYDRLIVSEAFAGADSASAVSSYLLGGGYVYTADASVATHQTAACWIAMARASQFAYTTNTGSASISGYTLALDGSLTLLDADGRTAALTAGAKPTDTATSRSGDVLAVLSSGTHELSSFAVATSGALTLVGHLDGLPAAAAGLAAE